MAYLLSVPTSDPTHRPLAHLQDGDGGKTWKIQFEAAADQFHDCFAFFDPFRARLRRLDRWPVPGGPHLRRADLARLRRSPPPRRSPARPASPRAEPASPPRVIGGRGSPPVAPPATAGGAWTTRVFYTHRSRAHLGRHHRADQPQRARTRSAAGSASPSATRGTASSAAVTSGWRRAWWWTTSPARSDGGRTWTPRDARADPRRHLRPGLRQRQGRRGDGGRDDDGEDGHGHDEHGDSIRVVATAPTGHRLVVRRGSDAGPRSPGSPDFWAVDFGSEQTGWLVGDERAASSASTSEAALVMGPGRSEHREHPGPGRPKSVVAPHVFRW